jgi:hypothetical protein
VAYLASAELNCHLALGWPLPERILDLYVEFRNELNGSTPPHGFGLVAALLYRDLDAMDVAEKKAMQELANRGGPWSAGERSALLDYCESDVLGLAKLLPMMVPTINLAQAILCRGRYMRAVARMESAGIPIDVSTLSWLLDGWGSIEDQLIAEVDSKFGVYDGRTFKTRRWEKVVNRRRWPWPRLASGTLALDSDTFRSMAHIDPDIALMHELRTTLAKLRLSSLTVGTDGRNRVMLSPFRARSGRNAPSNSKFVFGPSTWIRGLIKPGPGRAVAYLDWSQQEFGIAAVLSGDRAMQEAYLSGDPYLMFGKQARRIPPDGTKQTHSHQRNLFKTCVLGVQYGMGDYSLGQRIGRPTPYATELLQLHRRTYPEFWRWSDAVVDTVLLKRRLPTRFGWVIRPGPKPNQRSLRNFPCQANGAEMLRLACSLATERGISIVAPVHDALMIEAPADEIEEAVARTQAAMVEASEAVLDGFRLRSDATIVRWPDRFMDDRGREFWDRVIGLLRTKTLKPCMIA